MVIAKKITSLTIWTYILPMILCHDIDITSNTNVTTLYPVANKTIIKNETDTRTIIKATPETFKKATQSWKIESAFAESNITEVEVKNNTEFKKEQEFSNPTEENEPSDSKEDSKRDEQQKILNDFKPSQHLGSFFDDDSAEVIKTPIAAPVFRKPPSAFTSSLEDKYQPSYNKIPKEIYQTHQPFPYKFEDAIYTKTKDWSHSSKNKFPETWPDSIESKPTVEVPVRVPAGGFYSSPDAFKEKPLTDEEYGFEVSDVGNEHRIRKRVNPWQNLLRLVTAFIPVGLIISALTPSVITIHNVDDTQAPSLPYRRTDTGIQNISPISERCRRRLLCELHSDRHYQSSSPASGRKKHCYKLHCEDTEALWKTLRWLFTYNQDAHHQGQGGGDYQHADDRGRHFT